MLSVMLRRMYQIHFCFCSRSRCHSIHDIHSESAKGRHADATRTRDLRIKPQKTDHAACATRTRDHPPKRQKETTPGGRKLSEWVCLFATQMSLVAASFINPDWYYCSLTFLSLLFLYMYVRGGKYYIP